MLPYNSSQFVYAGIDCYARIIYCGVINMTIQEAKDYVIYMFCGDCPYAFDSDCSDKKCKQAMDMVYNALNKQAPKKPKLIDYYHDNCGKPILFEEKCPNCERVVSNGEYYYNFCPKCGQCIDWSE